MGALAMKKVVLVYSGGLDTSVCIPLMREEYEYDHVITVTVDVGQPEEDIREAESKAQALGTEHYTLPAKRGVRPRLLLRGGAGKRQLRGLSS
jgi:argininosuccinate synthase